MKRRQYKFRAWDKRGKQWILKKDIENPNNLPVITTKRGFKLKSKLILCLFTDIKDKNNTEIYDGDIIRTHNQSEGVVMWGEYDDNEGYADLSHIGWYVKVSNEIRYTLSDCGKFSEIIGNIFENKNQENRTVDRVGTNIR